MSTESLLTEHATELASRVSKAYALAMNEHKRKPVDIHTQSAVAEMIDALVAQDVRIESGAFALVDRIGILEPNDADKVLLSWSETVIAASPSRACMRLAVSSFEEWFTKTTSVSRVAFLDFLPAIAPKLADLRHEGVVNILEVANKCSDAEECHHVLTAVGSFTEAGRKVLLPIIHFLVAAAQAGDMECVDFIKNMAQVHHVQADLASPRFFGALPKWNSLPVTYGTNAWRPVLFLALSIANKSCSSAEYVLRRLPRVLRKMDEGLPLTYIEDFHTIVTSIGIRGIGFSLSILPGLYSAHGVPLTRQFVRTAKEAAERYGRIAGEWFLERKTRAAEQILRSSRNLA